METSPRASFRLEFLRYGQSGSAASFLAGLLAGFILSTVPVQVKFSN